MEKPKFYNVPNEHLMLRLDDGKNVVKRDIWISRATSVDGIVLAITDDGMNVLITKRSDKMRDETNKYCIPCGYLDFGETRHEAMIREVYEETSLYLPDYKKYIIFDNGEQPFMVKDNPKDSKNQNIANIYITVLDFRGNIQDFPIGIEKFSCAETSMVKWISAFDFYNEKREWAFNHEDAIDSAFDFFNSIHDEK